MHSLHSHWKIRSFLYFRDLFPFVQKASSGKVDVIIEMLANVNLEKDLELASRGTRIVVSSLLDSLENSTLTNWYGIWTGHI